MGNKPILEPSGLGEFVNHGSAPMFAKLHFEETEIETGRNWKESFQPLSPLLSEEGSRFENEIYNKFTEEINTVVDSWSDYENQSENNSKIVSNLLRVAKNKQEKTIFLQAHLAGDIGAFYIAGDADLVLAWPAGSNEVQIRIFDIKASWNEKTYHRIQTATYTLLLEKLLESNNINFDYSIEAGIITRETNITSIQPDNLPFFSRESVETDVKNLVKKDGILDRVRRTPIDDIPYQFDEEHLKSCPYSEATLTHAIEKSDPSLLGLTRGEQKILKKHGFETLEDIAEIVEPPDNPKPYDYEYPDVRKDKKEKVSNIAERNTVGERLPILSQKAQSLLSKINPSHDNAHNKPWTPWIVGTGNGDLPDDDPHPKMSPSTDERGELIKVYLNIQVDYIRDNISVLSGRVDCENNDGPPLEFSESIQEIPDTKEGHTKQEKQLLEEFFEQLFSSITLMRDLAGQSGKAPVHLYFYTENERNSLMDAVKRHPKSEYTKSVRDLLGMKAGIDQSMSSVVQTDIKNRLALKTVSDGILPISDQLTDMVHSDWEYERENGEEVNLKDIFYYDLFDYRTPYVEHNTGGIEMIYGEDEKEIDGWYPNRSQFDAQIPLEYIWAAVGEFDTSWTDNPQYKGIIKQYMWVGSNKEKSRIKINDVEQLSLKFCEALEKIENNLMYKNPDIKKEPIDVDSLTEFSLGETTLASACQDYLDLEYSVSKQEVLSHYQKPIRQRVLSGESIPMKLEEVEVKDGLLYAKGELIYENFDLVSPQLVAESCKKSGKSDSSGGSRMVATEISKNGDTYEESAVEWPSQILNSVPVTIDNIDTEKMEISIRGFPNGGSDEDYTTWHKNYVSDASEIESDFDVVFEKGKTFILDPCSDDLTAKRASVALENIENNSLYNTIQRFIEGEDSTTVERFDSKRINKLSNWFEENYHTPPNKKQQEFINELGGEVNLLQGPPGTGKTSGAMSPSILSRIYASSDTSTSGLVTGASNKSIDELMEDVASMLKYLKENHTSDIWDNIMLIRLTGEPPQEPIEGVNYVNYHTDKETIEALRNRIRTPNGRQSTLMEHETDSPPHTIIFATPSRTFGLIQSFARQIGDIDPGKMYKRGINIFDFLAIDEASMLPLPQLFLVGAFMNDEEGWQTLISGDQRQMPPVQKHDWKEEDRRSIEEAAPFLSTLDYFRFLRGENIDSLEDFDELESPNKNIPITRLRKTYRCHKEIAEFLRRWVYKQDNIDYKSEIERTIRQPETSNEAMEKALNPSSPLTLLLHDENNSRQSNPSEASIIRDIVKNIPDSESVGIVTPHNSQKGLLNSVCNRGLVDTVERFQGGEKDVMIVSATVSDPDYLSTESDFILNPNRLNVALSRMRKKLIVVAPQTLFEIIPNDIKEYENASIWKGLYSEVKGEKQGDWNGKISQFIEGNLIPDKDSNLSIHTKE